MWVAILLNAWNKHQSSCAEASLDLLCPSDGTASWRRGDRIASIPDKWKCSCLEVTWNWTHSIVLRVKIQWFFGFNYTGEAFRQWFKRVSVKSFFCQLFLDFHQFPSLISILLPLLKLHVPFIPGLPLKAGVQRERISFQLDVNCKAGLSPSILKHEGWYK